jgi:hypothetical protein
MLPLGTRVKFNEVDEYGGKRGTILSVIPRRYRASPHTYRIQIDGFPIMGGWNGVALATGDRFEVIGINHDE